MIVHFAIYPGILKFKRVVGSVSHEPRESPVVYSHDFFRGLALGGGGGAQKSYHFSVDLGFHEISLVLFLKEKKRENILRILTGALSCTFSEGV